MANDDLVHVLARAGMAANLWIVGHARHGWYGLLKDAIVVHGAGRDVPAGPLTDELHAAARIMAGTGPDIAELHVDVSPGTLDDVRASAVATLTAVGPTLAALPDQAGEQASDWIMDLARRTAEAARDDFRGERVSDVQHEALLALGAFLRDPGTNALPT